MSDCSNAVCHAQCNDCLLLLLSVCQLLFPLSSSIRFFSLSVCSVVQLQEEKERLIADHK